VRDLRGALLALGDRGRAAYQRAARYAEFGRQLGLCFQIRDDILGIWGVEAETGKPTGSDIRRRKKSLPVVIALREADSPERARMLSLYSLPGELTADQELEVRQILDRCHAAAACQREADIHAQEALCSLAAAAAGTEAVEANPFHEALRALTCSLSGRRS
jgi:geranylgeranyl diphosphate synthase type I